MKHESEWLNQMAVEEYFRALCERLDLATDDFGQWDIFPTALSKNYVGAGWRAQAWGPSARR
jgi:hypothetical protein